MNRILILDDEESYRHILGRLLERCGFDVRSAADSERALEISEIFQPDLLVVDWMIGGSQVGPEIAARIQQDLPKLRTILITGYLRSQIQDKYAEGSVDRVLEKPFQLGEFLDVVDAVLAAA